MSTRYYYSFLRLHLHHYSFFFPIGGCTWKRFTLSPAMTGTSVQPDILKDRSAYKRVELWPWSFCRREAFPSLTVFSPKHPCVVFPWSLAPITWPLSQSISWFLRKLHKSPKGDWEKCKILFRTAKFHFNIFTWNSICK